MKRNFTYEVTRHLLYMYITHTHTHHCVITPPYASSLHVRFTHQNNRIFPLLSLIFSYLYPFVHQRLTHVSCSLPSYLFPLLRLRFMSFLFPHLFFHWFVVVFHPLPFLALVSPWLQTSQIHLLFSLTSSFFSFLTLLLHSFSKSHSSILLQSFLLFVRVLLLLTIFMLYSESSPTQCSFP